jgi:8-amino-7-oxononanoate synthase
MNLLEKFSEKISKKTAVLPDDIEIFGTPIEEIYSATEAKIAGRRVIFFGTNNYLGLTFAPECISAAHAAIDAEGTGTTGSRMANGSYLRHRMLEQQLAAFYESKYCIIFTTGYQANLGVISGLAGHGDVLLFDADCHASIYDGCHLSGAELIRFKHNDPVDMEKRLRRLGDRCASTLIVVEGIYSMLGDRAPLAEMVRIKDEYGALLLIDEAHSLGVLGQAGRGLVEEAGVLGKVDFITGTFSKSLGGIGGFCVSDHPELDMVRYVSRPYIFTASSSPATIASTQAALKILEQGTGLRKRLWEHCHAAYTRLSSLGYTLGPEPGPIIAVIFDSHQVAIGMWRQLLENNIYTNLVLPPAVPGDKSLIRCSISAAHTPAQIDYLVDTFAKLREQE